MGDTDESANENAAEIDEAIPAPPSPSGPIHPSRADELVAELSGLSDNEVLFIASRALSARDAPGKSRFIADTVARNIQNALDDAVSRGELAVTCPAFPPRPCTR